MDYIIPICINNVNILESAFILLKADNRNSR